MSTTQTPPAHAADPPAPADSRLDDLAARPVIGRRHPWRWVASLVVLVLLVELGHSLLTNPVFQWDVFRYWFFRPIILEGLRLTLWLTAAGAVLGFVGGVVLALMRQSRSPLLQAVSWGYVWIFRSIPLIVLLLFLANFSALYDTIGIPTVPFGPVVGHWKTVDLLSYEAAAIIGISLNEAAYASEIVRGGILAVDQGQTEAANALGLPRRRQFTRIVLPQATRTIVPNYVNQLIGLLKGTSVVYITSLLDLFGQVQTQASRNQGQIIPLLLVATAWYVVLTSLLSVVQYYVERHYSKGALRTLPPTPAQRLVAAVRTRRGVAR
jgi:polar amino acid transport system permease protein